jgi:hypothetical protein
MAALAPASSVSIEHIKLPPPRRRLARPGAPAPVEFHGAEAQVLVAGSGLVAAADEVPARTREDLVNCTLFAQLAATAAVPESAGIERWYGAYFRTLTAVGWSQSETQQEEYDVSGKNAEAHQAILAVLATLLGPEGAAAVAVVKAAVEALAALAENRPWLTLFERESRTGKSARFQVATAQVAPHGLLQAALVGFTLHARSALTQVLFFKFASSAARLHCVAGKATIGEETLAGQRDAIAGRLAAYRSAYVGEVRLPVPDGGRTSG